ncbi:uncharacterized protein LOC114287984 [Camellia sinensis]|nr:uncharacterized protein LOC114287984 [Camellia sinensis]
MEQAAAVYTNKIFEEFQDEYVKSLEVNIEEIENDGESTVYTVLDSDGIRVRKVRQECDDSMPSMYSGHGTYQALLNNASSYHSQASNSPACSEVLYGRGRGRGHGDVDHTPTS